MTYNNYIIFKNNYLFIILFYKYIYYKLFLILSYISKAISSIFSLLLFGLYTFSLFELF